VIPVRGIFLGLPRLSNLGYHRPPYYPSLDRQIDVRTTFTQHRPMPLEMAG